MRLGDHEPERDHGRTADSTWDVPAFTNSTTVDVKSLGDGSIDAHHARERKRSEATAQSRRAPGPERRDLMLDLDAAIDQAAFAA